MKKTIATITLAAVMTFGATFANASGGIIVAGATGNGNTTSCTQTADSIVGIIVAGLTGIIVAGATDSPCTTTTSDLTGIIVAG